MLLPCRLCLLGLRQLGLGAYVWCPMFYASTAVCDVSVCFHSPCAAATIAVHDHEIVICRLLQRPVSLSGAAAQAGLAAGRAEAALPMMEGMPAGLRRIAGQAAQLLTSHVCPPPPGPRHPLPTVLTLTLTLKVVCLGLESKFNVNSNHVTDWRDCGRHKLGPPAVSQH